MVDGAKQDTADVDRLLSPLPAAATAVELLTYTTATTLIKRLGAACLILDLAATGLLASKGRRRA